jgi:hypothetical protein
MTLPRKRPTHDEYAQTGNDVVFGFQRHATHVARPFEKRIVPCILELDGSAATNLEAKSSLFERLPRHDDCRGKSVFPGAQRPLRYVNPRALQGLLELTVGFVKSLQPKSPRTRSSPQ